MNLLKEDIKKLPVLMLGFILIAIGIVVIKNTSLGLFPWGVLHEGLVEVTPFTLGQVTQLVGVAILLLSLCIKIYPGLGTLLNILCIGFFVDVVDKITPSFSDNMLLRLLLLALGIAITSLGRALYIQCRLGKGPRDGLFVGMTKFTGISVKYTKPFTEIIAVGLGWILGGVVGIGTVIMFLFSGVFVNWFFKILKYDPKTAEQRTLTDYFYKKKNK